MTYKRQHTIPCTGHDLGASNDLHLKLCESLVGMSPALTCILAALQHFMTLSWCDVCPLQFAGG